MAQNAKPASQQEDVDKTIATNATGIENTRGTTEQTRSDMRVAGAKSSFQMIGRYQIVRKLGAGGMGTVYLATDTILDRQVALKVPQIPKIGPGEKMLARFLREARAGARLRHPHIATVFDVGEDSGMPYVAMEFIQGVPLDQYCETTVRRLTPQKIAELIASLADAMQHAHDCQVVHRDLKPSNIMLLPDGSPRVLDFGLSRLLDDLENHVTRDGQLIGSPAWMSPEQARGTDVDQRTDIYSLGCILYQLLTAKPPFSGTLTAVLLAVTSGDFRKPRDVCPEAPEELESLCLCMMNTDRNLRPQTMAEVCSRVQALSFNPTPQKPASQNHAASPLNVEGSDSPHPRQSTHTQKPQTQFHRTSTARRKVQITSTPQSHNTRVSTVVIVSGAIPKLAQTLKTSRLMQVVVALCIVPAVAWLMLTFQTPTGSGEITNPVADSREPSPEKAVDADETSTAGNSTKTQTTLNPHSTSQTPAGSTFNLDELEKE